MADSADRFERYCKRCLPVDVGALQPVGYPTCSSWLEHPVNSPSSSIEAMQQDVTNRAHHDRTRSLLSRWSVVTTIIATGAFVVGPTVAAV